MGRKAAGVVNGAYGECTSQHVCKVGFECKWNSKFYAQCKYLPGGPAKVLADNKKANEQLPTLEKEDKELHEKKVKTDKTATEAEAVEKKTKDKSDASIHDSRETKAKILKGAKEKSD